MHSEGERLLCLHKLTETLVLVKRGYETPKHTYLDKNRALLHSQPGKKGEILIDKLAAALPTEPRADSHLQICTSLHVCRRSTLATNLAASHQNGVRLASFLREHEK